MTVSFRWPWGGVTVGDLVVTNTGRTYRVEQARARPHEKRVQDLRARVLAPEQAAQVVRDEVDVAVHSLPYWSRT